MSNGNQGCIAPEDSGVSDYTQFSLRLRQKQENDTGGAISASFSIFSVGRRNIRQVASWLVLNGNMLSFYRKCWILARQLGATFVMAKGGEMLLDHRQKDFGDQPTNAEILEALGLDSK